MYTTIIHLSFKSDSRKSGTIEHELETRLCVVWLSRRWTQPKADPMEIQTRFGHSLSCLVPYTTQWTTSNGFGGAFQYVWFLERSLWSQLCRRLLVCTNDWYGQYQKHWACHSIHSIHKYTKDLLSEQHAEHMSHSKEEEKTHQKWLEDSILGTKQVILPFNISIHVNALLDCSNRSRHYCRL